MYRRELAIKYANSKNVCVSYFVAKNVNPKSIVSTAESINGITLPKSKSVPPFVLIQDDWYDFIFDLGTSERELAVNRNYELLKALSKDYKDLELVWIDLYQPKMSKRLQEFIRRIFTPSQKRI